MKNIAVKSKKEKPNHSLIKKSQSLDPLELNFLEISKEVSKMIMANIGEYEDIVSKFKKQFMENVNRPLNGSQYRIVRDAFDFASPENFEQEPRSSLNYPISSAGADRSGNFHLGVGIGSPNVIIGSPPDFGIGDSTDFYRHKVSAKIGHEFPIESLEDEKNYTIKSHVRIPKGIMGKLQFEVNKPGSSILFRNIFYSGYLIGTVRMRVFVDDSYIKTVKRTFLQWYKTSSGTLGLKIPGINNEPESILLKTDLDVSGGSTVKVEVEVEIIVANTSFTPQGSVINPPNMFIGVQYFNPEFLQNGMYDNIRYLFSEIGESSEVASPIKLDFIEVSDTNSVSRTNTFYVEDKMQSH